MRLGVLDIGSNTGHLLVVDAHDGAAPLPAFSLKQPLRLAEHLDDAGAVNQTGIDALTTFTADALVVAEEKGCEAMLSFATSAVRDSVNSDAVLAHVHDRTDVTIEVLSGEDEARLTFLAVRRWFGWSAGKLTVFDIGGGSLEIATGADERPDVAQSLPLGAARLASTYFSERVDEAGLKKIRRIIRADMAKDAGQVLRTGTTHRAAATSKTFRSLARICGAAPSDEGPLVPRSLALADVREWIPKLVGMTPGRARRAARRLAQPHPPDRAGRARRRGVHGHLRPRRARDLPVGAARGRDPRAHRQARRGRRGLIAMSGPGRPRIGLSTSSVYPESTAHGFSWAAEVGYEAVEVMVGIDALSQQTVAIKQLIDHHEMPVCAIHAPCLLFTQRVWGLEPWGKLERSAEMAAEVGAEVVVVHPPFRWQRDYARDFVNGIAALEESTGIAFAVENMYPWRASKRGLEMYLPGWDPSAEPYANTTIDLSHAAIAHAPPIEMAERLGERLRHIHLTDGSGSPKDEHLVPGRGAMGAADFLHHLVDTGFDGEVVLEINTRRCTTREEREFDLRESLEFAREHLTVTETITGP